MKCETCKYWGIREAYDGESELFTTKRCGKAVQMWNAGEYHEIEDEYKFVLKSDYIEQKMFVKDGSDYMADLYTTADFFCAHHTAIE